MSKHVIIASEVLPQPKPSPTRYFVGYRDRGERFEALWTADPWKACWIDAAEVAVETALLASVCPNSQLSSRPLDAVSAPRIGSGPG